MPDSRRPTLPAGLDPKRRFVFPAILTIGLCGRLVVAFCTSFHADELYPLLAARGILSGGLPRLPSGVVWPMGGPLLYLQAPLVAVFGFVEAITRLPSVAFSTLAVVVVYLWGRKLLGRSAALIAALVVATDPNAVVWGAYARPYSVLPVMLLTALALLRGAAVETRPGQIGIPAAIMMVAIIWTHPVTVLWLPAFFAAYVVWSGGPRLRRVIAATAICLIGSGLVVVGMRLGAPGLFESSAMAGSMFADSYVLSVLRKLWYFRGYPHRAVLAVPLFFCGLGWVYAMVRRRIAGTRRNRDITAIGTFIVVAILGLSVARYPGQHTMMALLAPVALLGAAFLIRVVELLFRRRPARAVALVWAVVGVSVLIGTAARYRDVLLRPGLGTTEGFRYVRGHWAPGDAMLNSGPCALIFSGPGARFYYFIEIDYGLALLRTDKGYVDRGLGSPLVNCTEGLERILNRHRRIWYVVRASKFPRRISPASRRVVRARMKAVFEFGDTIVYLKDSG